MKRLSLLVCILALTITAYAADYTITLTAKQTAVLQRVADRLTQQRGTNVTIAQYIFEVVKVDLQQREAEHAAEDVTPLRDAYLNATPAQRAAARTALGL